MNIKQEKINDFIYRLTVENGNNNVNVVVLKGKEKTIVIDTAYGNRADELLEVIKSITPHPVMTVINTHHHADHTGANRLLDCPAISHENARERIAGKFFSMAPHLTDGVPVLTVKGTMTIHLDDEEIEIRSQKPAHTDGDLIIYLRKNRTLILGDLLFSETFPFIDLNCGGHIEGEMKLYRDIPGLYPDCELIVAGHGRSLTPGEFRSYAQTVTASVELVSHMIKRGLSKQEILESPEYRELKDKIEDGEKFAEMWVDGIWDSLKGIHSISAPTTEILVKEGIDKALDFYRENHGKGSWKSEERDINLMAYNLMFRKRNDEALRLFELYTELWPQSANSWDSLGEFHLQAGNKSDGRRYYEKALEMDPERTYIKEILEAL